MSSKFLILIYREINTMATICHPNILQFIGTVLDDPSGNPMIITEVMDTTLRNAYINRELTPDPSYYFVNYNERCSSRIKLPSLSS